MLATPLKLLSSRLRFFDWRSVVSNGIARAFFNRLARSRGFVRRFGLAKNDRLTEIVVALKNFWRRAAAHVAIDAR